MLFVFESRYFFWITWQFVFEKFYLLLSHVVCFWVMVFVSESLYLILSHVICFLAMLFVSESRYLFQSHVICFWVTLFVSESHYLFLSHVICFWVTPFVSESCYLFFSNVICFWAMSFFLCLKAVSAPVTVLHLNPPILFISHRKPIDPIACLPHCGSFCKLSVLIFRLLTWSPPENIQFLASCQWPLVCSDRRSIGRFIDAFALFANGTSWYLMWEISLIFSHCVVFIFVGKRKCICSNNNYFSFRVSWFKQNNFLPTGQIEDRTKS